MIVARLIITIGYIRAHSILDFNSRDFSSLSFISSIDSQRLPVSSHISMIDTSKFVNILGYFENISFNDSHLFILSIKTSIKPFIFLFLV
jgi:hypothetical protein